MFRVAMVAALQREVDPIVKHWRVNEREHGRRRFRFFEHGEAVLVCGGIGSEAARRAAEAALVLYSPTVVYSVGYAGSLDAGLNVGDVLRPARVIDVRDGSSAGIAGGRGVLLSHGLIANVSQKSKLRESFAAQAVDMEASGVARAAEARGVTFGVVKAVSDEFDFELPATGQFVDTEGQFQQARFVFFIALRPWLWPQIFRLAGNSRRATRALCGELRKILCEEVPTGSSDHAVERR